MKELNIKAIFDNAGGLILHIGDSYSHFYQDMRQGAMDFIAYVEDGTTEGWEGNEEELNGFMPKDKEVDLNQYELLYLDDLKEMTLDDNFEYNSCSVVEFVNILKRKL